jgi:hypothetical protein
MILCLHNIPRKDCTPCRQAYNRMIRLRHDANPHKHGTPVYPELALKAWRGVENGEQAIPAAGKTRE